MISLHRISTQTTRKFPFTELNSTFHWNWVFCFTLPFSSWWLINIFTELVVLSEIDKPKLLAGLRSRVVCLSCANLMNYQWPSVIYFQHLQNNYIVAKAMMTFAWFDPWTVKAPCRQFDELHMFPLINHNSSRLSANWGLNLRTGDDLERFQSQWFWGHCIPMLFCSQGIRIE